MRITDYGVRISVPLLIVSLLLASCSWLKAQDRPQGTKLLPFQESPKETDDEQLAIQFYQSRDFEKAAEVFERLYEKKPGSYYYMYLLFCYVENREYDRAEKLVKTARRSDPEALRYLVDQGYILYRRGEPEKARKIYDEALKKLPPVQQQVFDLANAFIQKNENEYAIRTYLKGRQLLNNSYPFSFELAFVYERTGDLKSELEEFYYLLELNKSYLPTIQDRLQNLLADDPDNVKNELFRKSLLEKVQKEPDKSWYSELLWWYSIQQKDFELALLQAKSLDRRLKEDGGRVMQLARLCLSNREYSVALEGFRYLIAKGPENGFYLESRVESLNTRYFMATSDPSPGQEQLLDLEKEFRAEIGAIGENRSSVSLMKNLAHLEAFYLGRPDDATDLLYRATDLTDISPQVRAEIKLELADILLFTDNVWEATLTYQQVYKDFKNDIIGQSAKFKNAKLSYYIGEFKWANVQLDILKAATSKLIANDAMELALLISENYDEDSASVGLALFSRADLLAYRNRFGEALETLDSVSGLFSYHPLFDDILLKKAEIRMKTGRYSDADTLLGTLVSEFPQSVFADKALMERARLHDLQTGDASKAMEYYGELMKAYPGSVYMAEARNRYRALRGDKGY